MKIVTSLTSLVISVLALGIGSSAFASGGPVAETRIECEGRGAGGQAPLIVFRLKEAYSSETRGDVLVYPSRARLDAMTTSMDDCWDLHLVDAPDVPSDVSKSDKTVVVCGNAKTDKAAGNKIVVSPNSKGYLAILQGGTKDMRGRIIKKSDVRTEDFIAPIRCSEVVRNDGGSGQGGNAGN